jgi:hypothetical protein
LQAHNTAMLEAWARKWSTKRKSRIWSYGLIMPAADVLERPDTRLHHDP